jgi:hypothetical protein
LIASGCGETCPGYFGVGYLGLLRKTLNIKGLYLLYGMPACIGGAAKTIGPLGERI